MSHHTAGGVPSRRTGSASDLYRAVWRWHFYAGLMVLPFLVILAVTGALYLFRDEIDILIHADLQRVEAQSREQLPPSELVDAALSTFPGAAVGYLPPAAPDRSGEISVKPADGDRISVYVNPYDGRVLGSLPDRGTVMWIVRQLHSLEFFGPIARGMIEIAGGWSILLVGTGIYLWWPRGRGGVLTIRGRPRRRTFWRDLHAVTGIFVGGVIVFLALTGMPWSVFWGAKVNEWANGSNFGYPAGVRVAVPMSGEHLDHVDPATAWSLEQAIIPESVAEGAGSIGLDRAVEIFERLGLHDGYAVTLPSGPSGVYTASVYPDELSQQRVVHLDQYSGEPLIDIGYGDYGPFGQALEWGINVHLGQQFGLANQLVLLVACIAIVALAISAAIMWWKRRPKGSLGAPPLPIERSRLLGVLAILAVGGIIFPLVGASLMVMAGLDWLAARRRLA